MCHCNANQSMIVVKMLHVVVVMIAKLFVLDGLEKDATQTGKIHKNVRMRLHFQVLHSWKLKQNTKVILFVQIHHYVGIIFIRIKAILK